MVVVGNGAAVVLAAGKRGCMIYRLPLTPKQQPLPFDVSGNCTDVIQYGDRVIALSTPEPHSDPKERTRLQSRLMALRWTGNGFQKLAEASLHQAYYELIDGQP
jgi:hypothetical protein